MTRKAALKTIFTVTPLAVLCILYGLWLVLTPPAYLESALYGGLVLGLFCVLYARFVPQCAAFLEKEEEALEPLCRTHRAGPLEIGRLLVFLVAGRALMYVLAYLISLYFNGYTDTFFEVQRIWADHPDAPRYISIVNKGYFVDVNGQYLNLLYGPLYPLIIRLFSPFYSSSIRAGFLFSNLNAILTGLFLYELVLHDRDRRSARRAVRFFCLLPPTFLLSCVEATSTFMLLSILCIYCARQKRIVLASFFGGLASLTQIGGLALFVPVLLELLAKPLPPVQEGEKPWKRLLLRWGEGLSVLLIPLAFGCYLLLNRYVSGDAFAFVHYMGGKITPLCGAGSSLMEELISAYAHYDYQSLFAVWMPGVVCLVLSLVCMLIGHRRQPASYVGYFLAYLLLTLSTTGLTSLPRALFACFPTILTMASLTRNRWADWLLLLLGLLAMVAYLSMYVLGWPVQ